ncbi:MAG: glycoside hydrolase family 31 protein, partial [Clostridia bacterium]
EMDVFLIAGPSLRDILGRYCMITGFAPGLPRWSYGLWMSRNSYENADIVRGIADRLRAEKIPCDVLHLDTYWFEQDWICDLRFSKERFPEPEKLIADLAKQGFSVSIWQMPYVHESQENYREGVEKDYFVKKPNGGIFHFDWFGKQYALMDFSNDDAVKWYVGQIKQVLGMGVKAVKTDIAEGCPAEGVYKTRDGREMHNLFPLIYNKSIFGAVKEVCGKGLVWARSTYAGGQRYPLPWSGDSRSTFENLAGALRSGISIGLSGQPFWSHDIGGFIGKPDPELYVRWAQLGLFSSHARCHGGGNSNPREPWAYGEEALRIFRSFAGLRYRLLPYIFSTEHQSLETGMPFIRHLSLHHQEDRNVHGIYDQYYFGESMMLAPILSRGGKRQVYLPDGTWFDYWTGQKAKKTGWIDAECPLDIMPIFIPAGSVITYGPEQQYVDEKKTAEIEIHVYGGADGAFSYRNDGDTGDFMVKYKDGRTIFDDGGYRGKYKLKVIE